MPQGKGCSIWLMPKGEVKENLGNLIKELSIHYLTPAFESHVTLIGNLVGSKLDVLAKTESLSNLIKPYQINLTTIDFLPDYFRSLFIHVQQNPEVMNANKEARKIFNQEQDPLYQPHLSLMYGDLDQSIKKDIIKLIGNKRELSFLVDKLYLYSTDGELKNWYSIQSFPLT